MPVRNAGPDAAEQVKVVLASNVEARHVAVAAPRGWSCGRVLDTATGSAAQCTRSTPMAAGATQMLGFALVVPGRPKRGTVYAFTADVSSSTHDPETGNNRAQLIR